MAKCLVCQTEYVEGEIETCPVCHWQLKPYSFLVSFVPDFIEQEKVKLEWARKQWAATKLQKEQMHQLQLQIKQARQKESHLQFQLEQALQERSRLQGKLSQVDRERSQLQVELERVPSLLLESRPTSRSEFSFSVLTLDDRGKQIDRHTSYTQYQREELGDGVELEIVSIAPGTFWMGSPPTEEGRETNEGPQHQVTVKSFWLGKYPVTQAQWQAVAALPQVERSLNPNPAHFKGADLPVEQVTWYEAVEFCARLNRKTGREYRLPSEAEWEYACRAIAATKFDLSQAALKYTEDREISKAQATKPFHFGDAIVSDVANYDGNYTYRSGIRGSYRQQTTPVGSFGVANAFGLYDLHGNIWEWCADSWHSNYKGAPTDGSVWEFGGDDSHRMLRGGAWYCIPKLCRSAQRHWERADNGGSGIGFRIACSFV